MATRRTRIKGIANLPQRRKTDPKAADDNGSEQSLEIAKDNSNLKISPAPIIINTTPLPESETVERDVLENNVELKNKSTVATPSVSPTKPRVIQRRTFIKPQVNTKLLARKPKADGATKVEDRVQNGSEDSAQKASTPDAPVPSPEPFSLPSSPFLSPAAASYVIPQSPASNGISRTTNSSLDGFKSGSDSEYGGGPVSPTKVINRSRIKAVPRLGQRRTSFSVHGSASESEDETKRNNKRIRTESTCSTLSGTHEVVARPEPPPSPQKGKEFNMVIQRKCKRTEQSRKMAEARRQFLHKFGNHLPDRQKLTMIDLIFYNPTTNPMTSQPRKKSEVEIVEITEEVEEATVDDPEPAPENEVVEEDGMPAPQIKIGENGEIVVDERSLVIENKKTEMDREKIAKSQIVDGDFDTGYGIYKRVKRSKDWTQEETLRFYKALNTVGTDFTMMLELFPGRTRRELKMKFKKEEKVNHALVDKALKQPVYFDLTDLRQETAQHERKIAALKEWAAQKKKPHSQEGKSKKRIISKLQTEVGLESKTDSEKQTKTTKHKPKHKVDNYSRLEAGYHSLLTGEGDHTSDDADNSSGSDSDSNSTEAMSIILKPTRSGRVPKQKGMPNRGISSQIFIDDSTSPPANEDDTTPITILENKDKIAPGSVMVIASPNPSGAPVYNIYMVTRDQDQREPVDSSDTNVPHGDIRAITQNAHEDSEQTVLNRDSSQNTPADEPTIALTIDSHLGLNLTIPAGMENVLHGSYNDAQVNAMQDANVALIQELHAT